MRGCCVALVALFAVGCSGDAAGEQGAFDCTPRVRVDDTVYSSYGYTDRDATRHATADRAECRDVGPDAPGSVLTDSPRQVTTWEFAGYRPDTVQGVRFDQDSYAVFIAGSVGSERRHQILEELQRGT